MRTRLWLAALAGAALVLWRGGGDPYWSGDFYTEAWPAYEHLLAGDLAGFAARLPGYAGFVTLFGAPSALLAAAAGLGGDATFRLCAVPGLLALCALAVHLAGRARAAGLAGWPLVLVLGAAAPLSMQALAYGHPEELLASALSVAAVLAALGDRTWIAAALLALAVITKQWAVLAVLPAALAAPRHGWRIAALGTGAAFAVLAPLALVHPAPQAGLVTSGALFHPHCVWWPLGVPATAEFTAAGHGTRMAPVWLQGITHPLIVALAVPLSAAWWVRAGRGARLRDDALALLALLFLERCLLDPWNLVYYHLPLSVALLAWEVRRGRPLPLLALGVNAAAWLTFVTYDERAGMGPFVAYLAWTLPLAAFLVHRLYGAPERTPAHRPRPAAVASPA